jgi:pyruvate/2-oxoglutarate dehydrogenase complex dihydrolipoamide dehydrogenase (E3) component/uncharacterized membrane protein YdjX (TVP38/TMEM64 family)
MKKYDYDAIVIGAGSGGLTSAIGLSKVGKKVLLVERDRMGGECTNTGCIPSKSLIHHAKAYDEARKLAGDTDKLNSYKESILNVVRKKVKNVRDEESPELVHKHHGVKVILGEASFRDAHTVVIKQKMDHLTHTAKYIVIATGSSARRVKIEGLNPEKLLTNENLFDLEEAPKKLLVIGGGAIGAEMAQALTHLGTKVTIANKAAHVLPREEPDVGKMTEEIFENQGMKIYNHSQVKKVEGKFAIIEQNQGKKVVKHKVEFDKLLLGVGRVPNLKGLNLEAVGIEHTDRGIRVDKHYRTNKKNIFAVGDVSSEAKFTHTADDQGRHVIKKILIPLYRGKSNKPIPRVTYLDQEVASVGVTCEQARKRYGKEEILTVKMAYGNTDRANTDEAKEGIAIVVSKRLTGKILGVTLMGKNAGELLSVFTLAMQYKISMYKLNTMIVPYPVLGRLYKKLSDSYIGQTVDHWKPDLKYAIKKQLPKIIGVIFWLIILVSFFRYKAMYDLTSLDIAKQIYEFVTGTAYGPFAYIIIYAFRPIIFFPATLLTLISGALFGFWGGVLYTIIGENLSANLAYAIGRFFGKGVISIDDEDGAGILQSWSNELRDNSFISVLIMRFIYLPFDLTNYFCGILRVNWVAYALATLIGILPGMVTFISFGATIENIESFNLAQISFNPMQLVVSITLFLSSLVIARLVQNYQKKRKLAMAS